MAAMIGAAGKEGLYWAFPKGHSNPGECPEDAAIRETLEEVGLDVKGCMHKDLYFDQLFNYTGQLHNDRWKLHPDFGDESKRPFCVYYKRVRLYLAVVPEAFPLTVQMAENCSVEWVPISDVLRRLSKSWDPVEPYREFLGSSRVLDAIAPLPFSIRSVSGEKDLTAMCAIYAPYVESDTCTWAAAPEELPLVGEWMEKWLKATSRGLPWLVAVAAGTDDVVGYCTVDDFRGRKGWQKTCEHAIYTAAGWQRQGVGKALLSACLQRCRGAKVACLMAVVSIHPATGAGAASCALHAHMGFEKSGYLVGVGFKLGKVLDCSFMSRYLIPINPDADSAAEEGAEKRAKKAL